MYRLYISGLLAGFISVAAAMQASAQKICRPALAFTAVQLSPMQPPIGERRWTAKVLADASRCATTAGYFEIGFSRLKENGVEVEFREQFIWSAPSSLVGVEFWADEAVEAYWVESIQACPCVKELPRQADVGLPAPINSGRP